MFEYNIVDFLRKSGERNKPDDKQHTTTYIETADPFTHQQLSATDEDLFPQQEAAEFDSDLFGDCFEIEERGGIDVNKSSPSLYEDPRVDSPLTARR